MPMYKYGCCHGFTIVFGKIVLKNTLVINKWKKNQNYYLRPRYYILYDWESAGNLLTTVVDNEYFVIRFIGHTTTGSAGYGHQHMRTLIRTQGFKDSRTL